MERRDYLLHQVAEGIKLLLYLFNKLVNSKNEIPITNNSINDVFNQSLKCDITYFKEANILDYEEFIKLNHLNAEACEAISIMLFEYYKLNMEDTSKSNLLRASKFFISKAIDMDGIWTITRNTLMQNIMKEEVSQ